MCTLVDNSKLSTSTKYGKGYKDSKLFFIKSFDEFISKQNSDTECIELIQNVRVSIFDYIGVFLTYDTDDMVSKIIKKRQSTANVIHLLDYIDCIFNEEYYFIIDKSINDKITDKIQLTNEDKLYYLGLITIETLKILIMNRLIDKYTNTNACINITNPSESILIEAYIACFNDRIFYSKNLIMRYYNIVKTNFSEWNDVIISCKNIIIQNNILKKN